MLGLSLLSAVALSSSVYFVKKCVDLNDSFKNIEFDVPISPDDAPDDLERIIRFEYALRPEDLKLLKINGFVKTKDVYKKKFKDKNVVNDYSYMTSLNRTQYK